MASGWNLWVWLECVGVVSGCCCKEVIDFLIILLIPTPLVLYCISSFLQQYIYIAVSLFLCSIFKCFSFLFMLFLCNIANVAQRTFESVQKSRSREHGDIIILTRPYVDCVHARVPRRPRARYHVMFQESCS